MIGLLLGVSLGLTGHSDTVELTVPLDFSQQGIKRGVWQGLAIGLIGSLMFRLIFGLIFGWIGVLIGTGFFGVTFGLSLGMIVGGGAGLFLGVILGNGMALVQHLSLRWVLYSQGRIPWNYAKFLKEASQVGILQQLDGGFRFCHNKFREHLAQYHQNQ